MQNYKKDRLELFHQALSLHAEEKAEKQEDFLTPDELTKFSRILKLMVFLDMSKEENPVVH